MYFGTFNFSIWNCPERAGRSPKQRPSDCVPLYEIPSTWTESDAALCDGSIPAWFIITSRVAHIWVRELHPGCNPAFSAGNLARKNRRTHLAKFAFIVVHPELPVLFTKCHYVTTFDDMNRISRCRRLRRGDLPRTKVSTDMIYQSIVDDAEWLTILYPISSCSSHNDSVAGV
uniref:Uncharacterized protein n=1 Tax=Spongospora subterranea TaxID=70186 RepID=A0A0H5RC53_9EUKA|eukprot:CRZ06084.1 hypothetical protein [Spongospora subterranea]